ncbi:hypothetical protein V8D89_009685 [Ganoderma adspersum]
MPSVPVTTASHTSFPSIIPDTTHPAAPPVRANGNLTSKGITLSDILRRGHAVFLLSSHDEEQSQTIFSDSDSGAAETGVRNELERTCGTVEHPHVLALALHGDVGLLVRDTVARGQLDPFCIPDRPENASTPPTDGRPSARVARRNRFFAQALGGSSAAGPRGDASAIGDVFPPKVGTQRLSPMEPDGAVRKPDHVPDGAAEGCAEGNSTSLKPTGISTRRDSRTSKAKACTTAQ